VGMEVGVVGINVGAEVGVGWVKVVGVDVGMEVGVGWVKVVGVDVGMEVGVGVGWAIAVITSGEQLTGFPEQKSPMLLLFW